MHDYEAEIIDTEYGRTLRVVADNGAQHAEMMAMVPPRVTATWMAAAADDFLVACVRCGFSFDPPLTRT